MLLARLQLRQRLLLLQVLLLLLLLVLARLAVIAEDLQIGPRVARSIAFPIIRRRLLASLHSACWILHLIRAMVVPIALVVP